MIAILVVRFVVIPFFNIFNYIKENACISYFRKAFVKFCLKVKCHIQQLKKEN